MAEECMGTEWGQGGVGGEPTARSWADSWSMWDPNLRKLDSLDTRVSSGCFPRPEEAPDGGRGQSSNCFQQSIRSFCFALWLSSSQEALEVLCSQAQCWRGKITEIHQCACGPRKQSLSPGQLLNSKVPSSWHGQVSPPEWSLTGV